MEMVATSKMKRAQDRVVGGASVRATRSRDVIASLYSPELAERFPLLRQPAQSSARRVILLTANRGLAGGFNANLIKEARALIAELEGEGIAGRRARRRQEGPRLLPATSAATSRRSRIDIGDRPTAENAAEIVERSDRDVRRAVRSTRVYVMYANFNSALSTPPTTEQILPVHAAGAKRREQRDYLLFPIAEAILDRAASVCTCATRSIARWSRRRRRAGARSAPR